MLCTKIRYPSEKAANKALHNQQKWGAQVKRFYFCECCSAWHLTSSEVSFDGNGTKIRKKVRKTKSKWEKNFNPNHDPSLVTP